MELMRSSVNPLDMLSPPAVVDSTPPVVQVWFGSKTKTHESVASSSREATLLNRSPRA